MVGLGTVGEMGYQEPLGEASLKTIDDFLWAVNVLGDNIAQCWSLLLFPHEHSANIFSAWEEVLRDTHKLHGEYHSIAIDPIDPLPSLGDYSTSDSNELEKVGLGKNSSQLAIKLDGFSSILKEFKLWPSIKTLSKIVAWVVSILASLAKALPYFEPLKEFFDLVKDFMGFIDD